MLHANRIEAYNNRFLIITAVFYNAKITDRKITDITIYDKFISFFGTNVRLYATRFLYRDARKSATTKVLKKKKIVSASDESATAASYASATEP